MNSALEPESDRRTLQHKLKESFTPTYLTVLSIIQGVALTDLAGIVVNMYQQFSVVNWLLVFLTFWVLITVWDVYRIQGNVWDWIPDMRDAAIPFIFGALELFLNHAITLRISAWLLGIAGIAFMGALGAWHMHRQAGTEAENAKLLSLLKGHHLLFVLYYIAGGILSLLLALASHLGNFDVASGIQGMQEVLAIGILLIMTGSLAVSSLISYVYWRKAVVYARTGRMLHWREILSKKHSIL